MGIKSFLNLATRYFGIGRSKYVVGRDLMGNSYIEMPSLSGSKDPRHTRRAVQWREKKELGDYDQRQLPVQWVMWLRHTRRDPPSLEELERDRLRILTTQRNSEVLRLRFEEERRRIEEQEGVAMLESGGMDSSNGGGNQNVVPNGRDGGGGARRVAAEQDFGNRNGTGSSPPQQYQEALERRRRKRAEMTQEQSELDRAKREMSKSPLEAFTPAPSRRR
ncbi:hypothetical protein IE53DRAFT_314162 [Violaceomyces palustris]|uniref:Uncharacterized protein n=1 Tax=Violaceomyces palustris TaxID=1673888 RepID=A0ACD0NZS6_9BASI|nr:hypothetical protein IE53DRAFT_314162 [Violaceomyces palustris]